MRRGDDQHDRSQHKPPNHMAVSHDNNGIGTTDSCEQLRYRAGESVHARFVMPAMRIAFTRVSTESESDRRLRRTAAMTGSTASGAPLAKGIAVGATPPHGRRSVQVTVVRTKVIV